MNKKMIAIIPARGGSKGLPGKNIKPLNGLPMIGYAIREAQKSEYISDIIVSTDSPDIANVAEELGASVPFLRPEELAGDTSSAIDVYIYTIERLNVDFGYNIENFTVLQPTSPLRTTEDIDGTLGTFFDQQAESVISVTEAAHPPVWAKKIDEKGILRNYFPEYASNQNRQEINIAYMPNGAVFVFNYPKLKTEYGYYFEKTYPFIMPAERSVDVDTLLDFEFAEFLMKRI